MSAGSPSIKVRIQAQKLLRIREEIKRLNARRFEEEWTLSSFTNSALDSRLKELDRHRRYTAKKRNRSTVPIAPSEQSPQ